MRHILVGLKKNFGAGLDADMTKSGIQDLELGAMTVSRSDTDELIQQTATGDIFDTSFVEDTRVQFALRSDDGVLLSPIINPHTLKWYKTAYTASVAPIIHIGRDNTGTGAGETWNLPDPANHVGEYAVIRIFNLEAAPGVTNNMRVAEYLIKQGDTAADVHDGLYDKLTKYQGEFYATVAKTVDGSNYGYAFTGFSGKAFRVIPELLLAGSNVTIQTGLVKGHGLGEVLAELEKEYASYRGFNNTKWMQNELYTASWLTDDTGQYDVYVLHWTNPNKHVVAAGDDPMRQHLILAVPRTTTAPNLTGQLELVLKAVLDQSVAWDD